MKNTLIRALTLGIALSLPVAFSARAEEPPAPGAGAPPTGAEGAKKETKKAKKGGKKGDEKAPDAPKGTN